MYENNNNTNKNNGFDTANEDLTPIDLDSIVLDDLYRPTTTTNDANSSVDSPVQPNNSTVTPMGSLSEQEQEQEQQTYEKPMYNSENQQMKSSSSKYKRYEEYRCWVCGDASSGHHYGAVSCEACKLFFRRHSTAATPTISQCARQRNCHINLINRSVCSECRYRKCVAVGMDLNRATFGRHTSSNKSKYTARSNLDLSAEIRRLFEALKRSIDKSRCQVSALNRADFDNLLFPIRHFQFGIEF